MTGRTDDVASLKKWQDRIRHEMRHTGGPRGEFHLNPRTLKPVAPKIGEVVTKSMDPEVTMRRARDIEELHATIASAARVPQDKYGRPATVSQEVGWFWAEAEVPPFKAVHASSAEVKYASAYYETFHCGPFAKTQSVAR